VKSKWLAPNDAIPEMEFEDLRNLMRTYFDIATEAADRPYCSRFIGPPYNSFHPDCRSLVVTAHNRGTKVSPHNIKALMAKFEISEDQFQQAFNSLAGRPPESPQSQTARPN
jgi:hypothetical protein